MATQTPCNCPQSKKDELVPSGWEENYLVVLFTDDGRTEQEINIWTVVLSDALQTFLQSVVVDKKKQKKKQKALDLPFLIYFNPRSNHQILITTEGAKIVK